VLQNMDATAIRRWAAAGVDGFSRYEDELNRINVFPVADADTGTNLRLTMQSAFEALVRQPTGMAAGAAAALARGALFGARGNSGLVLSQMLRGLAEACDGADALTARGLRAGLWRCAELATAAFAEPKQGTALTVLDAAAQAARGCDLDVLSRVADAAVEAAADALAHTPGQLPALAKAGVVDAGGRGVLVLLDALAGVIAERDQPGIACAAVPRLPRPAQSLRGTREAGSAEFDYEVMYLLERSSERQVTQLRAELAGLGDSVAVVGDGAGVWHVHVHCGDVGAAIEAGLAAGRPRRITVIRFADQLAASAPARFVRPRAVVAVVAGAGAQRLFRGEGAEVVARPDVSQLVAAITGTRAEHVVVLPNTAFDTATADAAAEQARDLGQDVVVVPTASPVQGLAAMAVHDPSRRAGDDVVAMAEAAAATRYGELVVATEEALTWVGRCQPGDVLGLVNDEVVLIRHDVVSAGCALLDLMLSTGGEVVTALTGRAAPARLAEALAAALRSSHPEAELTVYDGEHAGSPLLVGVE
jgi:DAK2 domain fusion protein YloV